MNCGGVHMQKLPLPDRDYLRSLFDYSPEIGELVWKHRDDASPQWNAKYAGNKAGYVKTYPKVKVCGQEYVTHRLIWKMVYGNDPDSIDHLNRDKCDNRLCNLRDVSHSVNMRNKPVGRNTSGHKHIHWSASLEKWVVQLQVPGKGQRQVAWESELKNAIRIRNELMPKYGYCLETDAS